jgi:hypothetical protein
MGGAMTDYIKGDDGGGRQRSMPVNYPSNSQRSKTSDTPQPEKHAEKIITGNIVQRKKGFGRKFLEAFAADRGEESFWESIVADVLVAAAKRMVSDAVSQTFDAFRDGFERAWWGDTRVRSHEGRPGYINYNRIRNRQAEYTPPVQHGRTRHEYSEIVFKNRADAQDILNKMNELLVEYEHVSVGDFYDLVGKTGEFTDYGWGWTNLDGSRVKMVRGGWFIVLPRPRPIDD